VSTRETEARGRAEDRLRRQRDMLRPLGFVVIAAVLVGALNGHPAVSTHGRGLGVAAAFLAFAVALGLAVRSSFPALSISVQAAVIGVMGAAGVALVALQPHGSAALAGSVAVWMAIARLPLKLGIALAGATTAGLALAEGFGGGSVAVVLAGVLLCALLGLVAYFLKLGRASQETTELLLAQLEDAREEQLQQAAVAERSRIAAELHDVLAHTLSGAAIQLQGARKLVEREGVGSEVASAIERATELVREGLVNAREAVSALRGNSDPGVSDLEALVDSFRRDTDAEVRLLVEGAPYPLAADADLALYRASQEALTNIARYAPGAATTVTLRYDETSVLLIVEDRIKGAPADPAGLDGIGGGNGLAGLRERLRRNGGDLRAGPTESGWRVEAEVPA
jgi:signal transduction histidine kinase